MFDGINPVEPTDQPKVRDGSNDVNSNSRGEEGPRQTNNGPRLTIAASSSKFLKDFLDKFYRVAHLKKALKLTGIISVVDFDAYL